MWSDDNAASSVLAVVLMMGFVAAASVSLFVVGAATLTDTQSSAEDSQVENTFREFDKDIASVAYGRQKYRTNNFEIQSDTAAFRQQDSGQIKIIIDGTEEVNESVGSLVYEKDGSTIAYQAGGVWRGTGEDSRMVSKPPVEYQNGSLTFPIPVLGGEETLQSGELDIKKTGTKSPINDKSFVEGKVVKLEITSQYYMGWAEYFRKQTSDVAVEVDHSPPGDMGTVTVKLGRPLANGDFEDGVMATGGDDGDIYIDGDNTDDPLAATGEIIGGDGEENVDADINELDPAIERKVENAEEATSDRDDDSIEAVDTDDGATIDEAGTYYESDGIELDDNNEDLVVDVSDGDVTMIVDGDIELDDSNIEVVGTSSGNSFRIYSTGNFAMQNTRAGPDWDKSAEHFQIYGTSEMLVAITGGGSTQFVGTIYAPREEPVLDPSGDGGEPNWAVLGGGGSHCDGWDMCVATGSAQFKGALVGGPTYMGQATSVEYDEDLETVEPTLQLDEGVLPPPITFLKVSIHTVEVNNSKNVVPASSLDAPASASLNGPASASAVSDARSTTVATIPAPVWTWQAAPAREGFEN